jgi:hypothetical protein
MIRLIRTSETHAIIEGTSEFQDLLYTGEINPMIRFYYCESCRKLIEISNQGPITTIEQLKNEGCPFCHNFGPFILDEKVESDK